MNSRSYITSVAMGILFAMAFSLSIAFVFLTTIESAEAVHGTSATKATSPQATVPPEPSSLLAFSSNGNGTCSVIGIGSCLDASIIIPAFAPNGDAVTAIAPRAFYGCPTVTAIHIPAGVAFIGNLAFGDCKSLSFITVSEDNLAYRSVEGVLYSADLSVLIQYPPKRAGESVIIHTSTTVVREMAFYDAAYLRRICYKGSADQWEMISVGGKNYALLAAAKEFGVT